VSDVAAPLPHHAVTFHRQRDVILLHWRVDPALVAPFVPSGCSPDVYDGSAWVALTAYVFADSTLPPLPPLGRFGTMTEVTVEILTIDERGRRGVSYRSIDTQHVPAIVAARLGIGLPYTLARAGSRRLGDDIAYRSRRRAGPFSRLRVRPTEVVELDETLLAAAGLGALSARPPDSVLVTPGADVRYSRG
jgi:hypothetical protein